MSEIVTVTERGPGRPPRFGAPMSAAQRKREQRSRDRRELVDSVGNEGAVSLRTLAARLPVNADISAAEANSAFRAWLEYGERLGFLLQADRERLADEWQDRRCDSHE